MVNFEASSASPADVTADLLVLPIFQGPQAGPGVDAVGDALAHCDPNVLVSRPERHGGKQQRSGQDQRWNPGRAGGINDRDKEDRDGDEAARIEKPHG